MEVPDTYKVEIGGLGVQTTPLSMLALAEVRDVCRTLQCGPRRSTVVDLDGLSWSLRSTEWDGHATISVHLETLPTATVSLFDGWDGHTTISVHLETLPTATVSRVSSLQSVYATEFNPG